MWLVRDRGQACYTCAPPYDRLDESRTLNELEHLAMGAVILVTRVPQSLIEAVARAGPSSLLIVGIEAADTVTGDQFDALRRVGASGILVLREGTPDIATLIRAARIAAATSSGQIGPRLELLGHSLTPAFEHALETLVRTISTRTTRAWANALGESVRTFERRCAQEWLVPSPRRWLELVRTIRLVQALQRDSRSSVESVLTAEGFEKAQTGRDMLRRVGAASPTQSRELIGWYWVVELWQRTFWSKSRTAHHLPERHA
jgi:hypothetical protein